MIRVDMRDGSKLMLSDHPEAVTIEIDGKTYTLDEVRAFVLFEPSVQVKEATIMARGADGLPEPKQIRMMSFEDASDLVVEVPFAAEDFEHIAQQMHGRDRIETAHVIPASGNGA